MTELCPAKSFFYCLDQAYELIKQDNGTGYYHWDNEFFFSVEVPLQFNGVWDGVTENVVTLRSVWVPPHHRGKRLFQEHLKSITLYATRFGVCVLAVANPFDLSDRYESEEELRQVFVEGQGFHLLEAYRSKQNRQRQRLKNAGFINVRMDDIQDRQRIKRKDCFAFVPDSADGKIKSLLLQSDCK